ncbi:hybrid sensor histidine kinase/response regulator transcription factor [Spirosoma radiotolerans]|uniref:histidine kinase n=1 Tax=Spirosoma radiotolerans TaxID=1379870 RepID=A0A0E3V8I5_9BACT|nr:two-component regulator propeller domain-containing protein [Spirosoma radiotolerans]AKD56782.1 transcriptional regulator [Spirosoma radiotolerans]
MVRLLLLFTLLISSGQGFPQVYQAGSKITSQEQGQPIANQFDHLSVRDGLSNNSVNCILQDREGFIWLGTSEGLNKYDGYTFTVLQHDPNHPTQSLQNNNITGLCEDHSGRLWVVTEGGGLHEVDKKTGLVTPHLIQAGEAHKWNKQLSIYEDKGGVIWISTFAGLARYQPAQHQFTLYSSPQPGVPIKTVFEDNQHRFWVATNRGLYLFDRPTGRFTPLPVPGITGNQPTFISFHLDANDVLWLGTAGHSLFRLDLGRQPWQLIPYNPGGIINPFVYMNSVHRDAKGILWVGTTNGLQGIDTQTDHVFTYRPQANASRGISSINAQAVYHDRTGMLWVGTDNGIDRQAITIKPFQTYQVISNKGTANLPENKVVALVKDSYDQLWVSNLHVVYRTKAGKDHFEAIPRTEFGSVGQHENFICALLPNKSDGIWLGTTDGLYQFDQATGHFHGYPSEVPAQFLDRSPSGDLWLGGEGGIASFNPGTHQYTYYKTGPNALPDKYVHGVMASRTGDVWVLIERQGICRLHPQTGRFTRYTAGPAGQLSSNDVQSIYEDTNGVIWVGTHQGGLNRFDPRTGLFSVISHRDGLSGNNVLGITGDRAGHLWLSTDQGLCRFDPYSKAIRHYELNNDLPSNDFVRNATFREQNQLYFGSLNGVVCFNPDSIRDDKRPFPVYITEINVLGKKRPLTDSVLRLNHDENFVSFRFSALSYNQSQQNQYAYQLVGVEENWVQNGNSHFANYTNLSPGHYTFRVKAANSDGIWTSKGASIHVLIYPPWWATWWAYSLYALLAGGAVWAYFRFYTNRIRQQQELELNRREAEQLKSVDELKTRLFSNITHEFRTPLSLIISPVEKLLQDGRLDASTQQILALVQRNADQLLRLINQLLDLSKLEAHHMNVSLMRGEVTEFVNHLVESFRQGAQQKNIRLIYTTSILLPKEQLFDADKWEKILTNLLSNALKFTPEGGQVTVAFEASPAPDTQETTSVQLRITDSGIGIPPENLPHIFDRFYQVDNSRTRSYEGTGIGLALVKELIELLGGSIVVESQLTIGTTFLLTLPVLPVHEKADAPYVTLYAKKPQFVDSKAITKPTTVDEPPVDDTPKPLVLVVEDNTELREFLSAELAVSYQVMSAPNGEVGWQLAQTELPDIVLSDLMMPQMDGYELTHRIKNQADTDHIAVILLTAKAAHQSRMEGLQKGADDYLAKPFHLDELHARLHNLITRQQKLRDQYHRQLTQPDAPVPLELTQDPFLHQIYTLLDKHLDDSTINVDWLANQVAMSRKTLYRKIHSLIQLAPNELIRQYRLRKAADLLRSGHSAAETAYLVGFKTPSHFSILFKEFYHKTPTEFIAHSLKSSE